MANLAGLHVAKANMVGATITDCRIRDELTARAN